MKQKLIDLTEKRILKEMYEDEDIRTLIYLDLSELE